MNVIVFNRYQHVNNEERDDPKATLLKVKYSIFQQKSDLKNLKLIFLSPIGQPYYSKLHIAKYVPDQLCETTLVPIKCQRFEIFLRDNIFPANE